MKINDIVYLKSNNEKFIITWLVGISENPNYPIDINKQLMMRPDYQIGDIAVKYGKDKKAVIPGKCLIDDLKNRESAKNQNFEIGNVVKHKLDDEEMTIIWIIGQNGESTNIINLNKVYYMNGYEDGDLVCGFFDKKDYKTKLFKAGEVVKIYE